MGRRTLWHWLFDNGLWSLSDDYRVIVARGRFDEECLDPGTKGLLDYYPGTEEAHTNPTRQRGECLRALAGASG